MTGGCSKLREQVRLMGSDQTRFPPTFFFHACARFYDLETITVVAPQT